MTFAPSPENKLHPPLLQQPEEWYSIAREPSPASGLSAVNSPPQTMVQLAVYEAPELTLDIIPFQLNYSSERSPFGSWRSFEMSSYV